eukprot:CAMPEP_0115320694 /NCGR_PEP_ID=MMETSP0270-20121206/80458_1 /TAXON_ID=71861 /ORGANISM="Scrippsiella trochoidea, Strain CCMP3099" /LENGTH=208 /DNA_ID=CAMNT_0002740515 /DNA_START=42 /DNA_END=663 /DNA_ORIENTATION=-
MGCCGSSSTLEGFNPEADTLRATKRYFGLGELPVSVKAEVKGDCIEICAVGLDQIGLLASLEQGFQRRRFWIFDATASARRGLFSSVGKFDLKPFHRAESVDNIDATEVLSKPCQTEFAMLERTPPTPATPTSGSVGFHTPLKAFVDASINGKGAGKTEFSPLRIPTPKAIGMELTLEDEQDARRARTTKKLAQTDAVAAENGAVVRL